MPLDRSGSVADRPAAPTRWCRSLAEMLAAGADYAGWVVDQYGVLHDGRTPCPGAADALRLLRARGQRVLVLSNSGKRSAANVPRLARFGATPDTYDRLLTSGELTWQMLARRDRAPFDRLGDAPYLLHPADDAVMIDGLPLRAATHIDDASFVLLASLTEEQGPDTLRPLLDAARARRLPLVCANPDIHRLSACGLLPGAGAVARLYEQLGGEVCWIGKPHGLIYQACREAFAELGLPADARICAVGDSLGHDIDGGAAAGFDTCFIAGGIHQEAFAGEVIDHPADRDAALARLCGPTPGTGAIHARPTWALPSLR